VPAGGPGSERRPRGGPADGHAFTRAGALDELAGSEFDVLVVGGGITGAGVALDAASRGLRTALVDKGDFASGTSSRSSKLVHGGLRYLQQHELRLVYENLAERQRLLVNAPHLVQPLPFLIPLFGRDGVVSKTVARSYASALWAYDLTGGFRIGRWHQRVSSQDALEHLPLLRAERLVAGFVYFDAQTDDARLTLAVLRTAVLDFGATAASYVALDDVLTDPGGRIVGARVRATRTPTSGPNLEGRVEHPGTPLEVRTRSLVNATGVWSDHRHWPGLADEPLRPAKGVHVTVPADRLPCDIGAVIPVRGDRRSIFVVPWPEAGLTYIGTTDTDYAGRLEAPHCDAGDVDYLLEAVNAVTTAGLSPADVTGAWAGLRPLLASAGHHRGRTADLSRRHRVTASPNRVVTVTGGKLTTYRKMAEDAVDAVVSVLGAGPRPCVTRRLRLRGASPGFAAPAPAVAAETEALRTHFERRYGSEAPALLELIAGDADLGAPAVPGLPYRRAEVVYAVRHEMAQTLDDVLTRRTRASLQRAEASARAAPSVAGLMAIDLGWTPSRVRAECERYAEEMVAEMAGASSRGARAGTSPDEESP
jgi:glycerol-3-phosphate dehydrogenase